MIIHVEWRFGLRVLSSVMLALLSGCWQGKAFYAAKESALPLPSGRYVTADRTGATGGAVTVTQLPSGATRVTGLKAIFESDSAEVIFFKVAGLPSETWITQVADASGDALFGVMARRESKMMLQPFILCQKNLADIAKSSVAHVPPSNEIEPPCIFPDRASLERAIRSIAPKLEFMAEVRPVR
jgi:hypothetical protein